MSSDAVENIANAVLYEGYMLYPYRRSAVKNRQRFNFGVLYPREHCEKQAGSDHWQTQTECLVLGTTETLFEVKARFLQMIALPDFGAPQDFHAPPERQEGIERDVQTLQTGLGSLAVRPLRQDFCFGEIEGQLELAAKRLAGDCFKVTLIVRNLAALANPEEQDRDRILLRSMVSVHSILHAQGGLFISLTDPPEQFQEAVSECRNVGAWPVLVGEEGRRDTMLSAPIILYDYPQIAPESPGDLFDGTEIDEILALRILTMTDQEKREVRNGDDRARQILERTEQLPPEHFQKLHGALRGLHPSEERRR